MIDIFGLTSACSLISFVQPWGLKHGLRSSSNSLSLFVFFLFFFVWFMSNVVFEENKKEVELFLIFRWDGLKEFLSMKRTPLYCGGEGGTKGFTKSYKNLHFYWILGAGHFVSQLSLLLFMCLSSSPSPSLFTKGCPSSFHL